RRGGTHRAIKAATHVRLPDGPRLDRETLTVPPGTAGGQRSGRGHLGEPSEPFTPHEISYGMENYHYCEQLISRSQNSHNRRWNLLHALELRAILIAVASESQLLAGTHYTRRLSTEGPAGRKQQASTAAWRAAAEAMLVSPRRLCSTMRIFSSAE